MPRCPHFPPLLCPWHRRCVTPYLLVPGPWTQADLEYVADGVAAGLTHNAGALLECCR